MRIKYIDLFNITLPLKKSIINSYSKQDSIDSIIIKIRTDSGYVGYGEAMPNKHVTGETFESTWDIFKDRLAPTMIGINPENIRESHNIMNNISMDTPSAKAAIDIACHDIVGKLYHLPIYSLLGGRKRNSFPIAHVIGMGSHEEMAAIAKQKVDNGYRALKVKIGTNIDEDIRRLQHIRNSVGDSVAIRTDANQGYDNVNDVLMLLKYIKPLNIAWIEQPLNIDNITGMREITRLSPIPIMADEGILNMKDLEEIIQQKSAHMVNIKLMKSGGIYPAKQLIERAENAGITCQIGSMFETSIGSAAGFNLAFAMDNVGSVELTGPLKCKRDIGNLHYAIPHINLNNEYGLGIQIDEQLLNTYTIKHVTVK